MDFHVPECSVSGAAGASVPWVVVSAAEVAEVCAARGREPAPDQGCPPCPLQGPLPAALPVSQVPPRTPLLAPVGKGGRCEQETCVKLGWQCWHLGGSRAPQTALVWRVSVCIPSLHSGGLAFLENQGRQAGGRYRRLLF